MRKTKFKFTEELKRIATLPYNHYFEEAIQEIRKENDVPADPRTAWEWFFKEHVSGNIRAAWPLFDSNPISLQPTARIVYDTEVPLERDIVLLMKRFRLPVYVFYRLLQYVLLNGKRYLDPELFAPHVEFEPDIRKGLPEWKLTITGIFPWTTRKQWDEIWTNRKQWDKFWYEFEDSTINKVTELLNLKISTKRQTVESYRKQMKQWSEWYQLCVIQGMSAVKALDKWEKDHPEQIDPDNPIDPSTVTRAVKDFQEAIRPVPLKE